MAGRDKKLPAMPGTSRKSSLQSPGRSSDPPSRRQSLLLPSPPPRFSSPYSMRSESPMRTLRNGKQQKMINANMLDGIPLGRKRTRSVIDDFDTQSLFNASFNDTASLAGDFNPPDSPTSLFSLFTPRRRSRNQNSESCSVMSMPVTTPRQKRLEILAQLEMAMPSRRTLINRKTNTPEKVEKAKKTTPKADTTGKKVPIVRKRKLKNEQDVAPVKKVRKNAKQTPKTGTPKQSESAKGSKTTTPIVRRKKKVINEKEDVKVKTRVINKAGKKNTVVKKRQKMLVSNALLVKGRKPKLTPQVLAARKISRTTRGKVMRGAAGKKVVQVVKRKRATKPVPTTELLTSVQRRKLQSIALDGLDMDELAKKRRLEKAAKKAALLGASGTEQKKDEISGDNEGDQVKTEKEKKTDDDTPEGTSKAMKKIESDAPKTTIASKVTTAVGPSKVVKRIFKKKVVAKPALEANIVPDVETVCAQVIAPATEMSTTITSAAATAAATAVILATSSSSITTTLTSASKPVIKKVSKPEEELKQESLDSSTDGETLSTLNQVSKILKEIADTPPQESAIENNIEDFTSRSENKTPRSEIRTPKNLEMVNKSNEDDGRENKTPPDPDNEYKPPKDIDSDAKTPPPSSPKISNTLQPTEMNGVDPQKDQVSPINSLASKLMRKLSQSPGITVPGKVVLPIINSLSAAAKQTSSFLNCTEHDPTSPTGPVTRRETQWKVNKKLIYNKIKTNKQNGGQKINSLALKGKVTTLLNKKSQISPRQGQLLGGLTPDGCQIDSESMNGKDMDTSSEIFDESNVSIENPETEDKIEQPNTEETVGLDSNENKVENKTEEPTATTADVVIPDKDTINDEHSSVTETISPSLTTTVTVIENNLDKEKTDKEAPIEKPIEKVSIEEPIPQIEPPNKDFEEDEEMPPLRLDDSFVTSSPFTTPNKQVVVSDDIPTSPESNKESEPIKNTTIMFEDEDLVAKASVLGALGLQSNKILFEQAKAPKVPKLRLVCRPSHKKHRRSTNSDPSAPNYKEKTYTVCREGDSIGDWDPTPVKIVKDPALDPCSRSLLWYPRMPISNGKALETLVEVTVPEQPGVGVGDGQNGDNIDGGEKSSEPLVIPEKSSSFAIHPGRLCEDVCCYCHNKFGLYDTPLHVAQLKGEDKQKAVLAREPLLTLESCLCDACFRHLDRPGPARNHKPAATKQSRTQPVNEVCCFDGCIQVAVHPLMRKWKRRVRTMLRRDLQEGKSWWTCDRHYAQLARVSECGMCLKRSASQQMYKLDESAVPRLNQLLRFDNIPVQVDGESYLCKKCRFYASLRLRYEDTTQLNNGNRFFLREHRSRVLKLFNVDPASVKELFNDVEKPKKQGKKKYNGTSPAETPEVTPVPSPAAAKAPSPQPTEPTPPLTPVTTTSTKPSKQIRIKLANPTQKNSTATHKNGTSTQKNATPTQKTATPTQKSATPSPRPRLNTAKPGVANPRASATAVRPSPTQAKDKNDLRRVATQNASTSTGKTNSTPVSRLSVNYASTSRSKPISILPRPPIPPPQSSMVINDTNDPYSFVVSPPPPPTPPHEFPTANDVGMNSSFDFQPLEPNSMWQKVNATFQFDKKTRTLWHQLHAPYGSYTSFLRHLVLLETHWRNGDLTLTPNASPRARQYLGSVRNRIEAYEGVPPAQETTSNVPLILDVRSLATEHTSGWNV